MSIPSNDLHKAFGEFKQQVVFVKDKSVAQAKILLAVGLRSVAYPFSGKINHALNSAAGNLASQAKKTREKTPSTSLINHVTKLGGEVLKDLKIKFQNIILVFKKAEQKPSVSSLPPASVSPRLLQKYIAIIDDHIYDTSDRNHRLSDEEKSSVSREFMKYLNKEINLTEFQNWVRDTETFETTGQRASIIRTCLENMPFVSTAGYVIPEATTPLPPQVEKALSDLNHSESSAGVRDAYQSIRKQKPKMSDLNFRAVKDEVNQLNLKPEQKTLLKAILISSLLQECAAHWDPNRIIKPGPMPEIPNLETLKKEVKNYKEFKEVYDQFVSIPNPSEAENVNYNNIRNEEMRALVRELPPNVTANTTIKRIVLQDYS